jgi:glucose-1-phosphate thymidylyltransferase
MELGGVLVIEDRWRDGASDRCVPAAAHVATEPIARHALAALRDAGVGRVVVVCSERSLPLVRGCLGDPRPNGVELRFVDQPGNVGLGCALRGAAPILAGAPCLVHVAAGLSSQPLAPLATELRGGPDAVVTVHHSETPGERVADAAASLPGLAELEPGRSALGIAGVWGFGPGGLSAVAAGSDPRACSDGRAGSDPSCGSDELEVAAVADRIAAAGGQLRIRVLDGWRGYRGRPSELLELNRLVLDRLDGDPPRLGRDGNRIEGRVQIHADASVRDSVIAGPVVIAAHARVADAYIGPYTAIGRGATVEGAEVERSIIADGASVVHVGTRITASVVGPGARVFRDFSLPRALRLHVGDDAEVGIC